MINNSSKADSGQALARVSVARMKDFLFNLANLMDDQSAFGRFTKRHAGMLPAWETKPDGIAQTGPAGKRSVMTAPEQEAQRIVDLREMLRAVWTEQDIRTKEYGAFLMQRRVLYQQDVMYGLSYGFPKPLPRPSPFEQAVFYLLKSADRARYCGNPDCPAPYFFAKRRSQKYCSDACALPFQREFKRQWWARHGRKWRAKREAEKVQRKRGKRK